MNDPVALKPLRVARCSSASVWLAAAAVLLLARAAAAQTLPPELGDYAVLALEDVTLRRETRVISGAVGAVGGTVRLARDARASGGVAAPTVRLGADARTGMLFCHFVSGPPVLPSCNGFADPLVDPAMLAPVPVVPGTTDLRVPRHTGTAPIPAGSFRDVRVGAGGLLQLAGGIYNARSVRVARQGRLVCAADCRIEVLGTVRLGQSGELGADSAARASTARVDVGASGPVPAFIARPRSNVAATIFAPAGRVILGPLGSYRGAFVGRAVTVGPRATVRGDSAL